jgi:hypothetical protein
VQLKLKNRPSIAHELIGFNRQGEQFEDFRPEERQVDRWPRIVQNSSRLCEFYDAEYSYRVEIDKFR